MGERSAEPGRADYEREEGGGVGVLTSSGGVKGCEGALDECSKHLDCSGVIPGGLEVHVLGKGPPGVLTCGAAEQGVFSCFDLLLAPRAEPRVWAMPIWMAQEVGGG